MVALVTCPMALTSASLRRLHESFLALDGEALDVSAHSDFVRRRLICYLSQLSQIRNRLSHAEVSDEALMHVMQFLQGHLPSVPAYHSAEGSVQAADELTGSSAKADFEETPTVSDQGSSKFLSGVQGDAGGVDGGDESAPPAAICKEAVNGEHAGGVLTRSKAVTVKIAADAVETDLTILGQEGLGRGHRRLSSHPQEEADLPRK